MKRYGESDDDDIADNFKHSNSHPLLLGMSLNWIISCLKCKHILNLSFLPFFAPDKKFTEFKNLFTFLGTHLGPDYIHDVT